MNPVEKILGKNIRSDYKSHNSIKCPKCTREINTLDKIGYHWCKHCGFECSEREYNMMSKDKSKNMKQGEMCYVCGVNRADRPSWVWLTDYGVRTRQLRPMCKSCIAAEKRGEL